MILEKLRTMSLIEKKLWAWRILALMFILSFALFAIDAGNSRIDYAKYYLNAYMNANKCVCTKMIP